MSKHTPGIWFATCLYDSVKGCHCGYVFDAGGDKTIAKVLHNDKRLPDFEPCEREMSIEEKNANARLIAAAPQLLEACRLAAKQSFRDDEGRAAVYSCVAAIAAAEGREA